MPLTKQESRARLYPLRRLMTRAWDSDIGHDSLLPERWHVFSAALMLELEARDITEPYRIGPIEAAAQAILDNAHKPYDKARWRALDRALYEAFGSQSGWA